MGCPGWTAPGVSRAPAAASVTDGRNPEEAEEGVRHEVRVKAQAAPSRGSPDVGRPDRAGAG
jgi:hypothetical protein